MSGWATIGDRRTYVPPFVNERIGSGPYWACSWAAALTGANIAALGTIPATHDELLALAGVSGDSVLADGSRTSHIAAALQARYNLVVDRSIVSDAEARRRLSTGWGCIVGVTYPLLTTHLRRWSPGFMGGHRGVIFGWDDGRTRWDDPLAPYGTDYAGEWVDWADLRPALWADEPIWVLEGELMQTIVTVVTEFDPPRRFGIRAGQTVRGYRANGTYVAKTFSGATGASFDRHVEIAQAPDPKLQPHGEYLRVVDGALAGLYVPLASVTADVTRPAIGKAELDAAVAAEYIRVASGAQVTLPPPPGGV